MAVLRALFSELDQEDKEFLQRSFQTISGHLPGELHSPNIDNQSQDQYGMFTHNYCAIDNCDCTTRSKNNNVKIDNKDIVPAVSEHYVDQTRLFKNIINTGVDKEDNKYLKLSFKCLKLEPTEREWISELSWVDHPPTSDNFEGIYYGCARTEEFCKVQKNPRSTIRNARRLKQSTQASSRFINSPYGKNYRIIKNTMSRNARSDQRRLYTAYKSITDSSLLKLNELKFRKKKLKLGKSEIHGLGLFAGEDIPVHDIIIEYVGEIIRPIIADIREEKYRLSGIGSYCFKIDDETIIDATKRGNLNRFINHSCDPNSFAKILNINNKKKIVIYSRRAIREDEEITYDYKMPIENEKILCLCKAPGCRKTLN